MGGGRFDDNVYHSSRTTRASMGVKDFAYSDTAKKTRRIHESLDPRRISKKEKGLLESRDGEEHPNSNAILVVFDVTGSNVHNAKVAQANLPELLKKIEVQLSDPQIAFGANDDFFAGAEGAFQISEFESDNRMDENLLNMWLVSNGGNNDGESYDLAIYHAARKTAIDCFEKRGRKGYMFLYADEPFFPRVSKEAVKYVFEDDIPDDISLADIIAEAQEKWDIFIIWPSDGYANARKQYEELFGTDNVLTLQRPEKISELIERTISNNEEKRKASSTVGTASASSGATKL